MKDWSIDSSWTLFLDRDGVINHRKMGGYIETIEEFQFLPQVPEAIARFTIIFQNIFVVTNQQGIGKGIMSERNLLEIHNYMCESLEDEEARITKCYYAPGLKSEENTLRKPNTGMGELAKSEYPSIDFSKAIMVGDSDSDILFGINLGMKTVRIKTVEPISIEADLTVNSLYEFAQWIEK